MEPVKLFMALLGCTPPGRNTEQHDLFFGIARELRDLIPEMIAFWPEANGRIHIDSWRQVSMVDGWQVRVSSRNELMDKGNVSREIIPQERAKLFFLNLGGYKKNEFEEYHYKMLAVCHDMSAAIQQAKKTAFYKHTGFKNAGSHIDDKYGIDVDDVYLVEDILPLEMKKKYEIEISSAPEASELAEDELHIGYFRLTKI